MPRYQWVRHPTIASESEHFIGAASNAGDGAKRTRVVVTARTIRVAATARQHYGSATLLES